MTPSPWYNDPKYYREIDDKVFAYDMEAVVKEAEKRERERIGLIVDRLMKKPNIYREGLTNEEVGRLLAPYIIACTDILSKLDNE